MAKGNEMSNLDSPPEDNQSLAHENLPGDTIVIEDTASTNFAARKIIVNRRGDVDITSGDSFSSNHYQIDVDTASGIFTELDKMWPLQPGRHTGIKSISFGHCTFLTYKGQRSPDLDSCMNTPGVKSFVSGLNVLRELEPSKQR